MNTPICDYVDAYKKSETLRLHMPGHKGSSFLGVEALDITEIEGADSLYEAAGIIRESEDNAGSLFGCATLFSTEGSSQCIRAMLYLAMLAGKKVGREMVILAAGNVHKTFLSAAALLGIDVEWMYPPKQDTYLSCNLTAELVEGYLKKSTARPMAVYLTSPDYLGNIAPVKGIAEVCHRYGVLLLVDNAHGAYLKFLPEGLHPIDLGADMCCDSAHKTLPVLTGGGYLHIAKGEDFFKSRAKDALALFGSTSPSYLILQSLDMANRYISEGYGERLEKTLNSISETRKNIEELGFNLYGSEPLKITILPKSHGQTGFRLAKILQENHIMTEFADKDALVLMFTPENTERDFERLVSVLSGIARQTEIWETAPAVGRPKAELSIREAIFAETELIPATDSLGRIFAGFGIACPPAVPLVVGGERIDENLLDCFEYYDIKECRVIK